MYSSHVLRALRLLGEAAQAVSAMEAERMFWQAAEKIWGQRTIEWVKPVFKPTEVGIPDAGQSTLAALKYAPPVRARGTLLLERARHYRLILNPDLLKKPRDVIEKIMIHEALHIGYPRHDSAFRTLVREHGGAVSENDAEGGGVKVQKKRGSRYETVKVFDDEHEAITRGREQVKADKAKGEPGRYRILL